MWAFDTNNCVNCVKIRTCPDAKVLNTGLRNLLTEIESNKGGSAAGVIVVVCKDRE